MDVMTPFQATWYPRVLALLRIVTGYLFIWIVGAGAWSADSIRARRVVPAEARP